MRLPLLLGCALFFGSGAALADDKPALDKEVVGKIIKRWKDARQAGQCCYREDIPDALSDQVRAGKVGAKDKPLVVGESAPRVAGLPDKRPIAVVFYRGHW